MNKGKMTWNFCGMTAKILLVLFNADRWEKELRIICLIENPLWPEVKWLWKMKDE